VVYQGFIDPSGGRGDAFAVGIGHREREGLLVVDVVRSVPAPFDPAVVVRGYARLLKDYGIRRVVGDAYSGEWVRAAFRAEGISYEVSARFKSQIYVEALPLFTRGAVELPDVRTLLVELASLERRTSRAGKDSVDHPRAGRDDAANVCCGVLAGLAARKAETWTAADVVMVVGETAAAARWREGQSGVVRQASAFDAVAELWPERAGERSPHDGPSPPIFWGR
jgi:hypothetical protein